MEANERLISGDDVITEKKVRTEEYDYIKVELNQITSMEMTGWELVKKSKASARMRKKKDIPQDARFENAVWLLFYKLGFKTLNKGRFFKLSYSSSGKELAQQIDVFAADEETILIVECKSSSKLDRKTSFKTEIEAIAGKKSGLTQAVKKLIPGKNLKVGFIFATNNYAISQIDKERMNELKIVHFDEDSIKYYNELINHIGLAAKYQLLGNIFAGQKIPEINNIVPAIEGEMGKHTYYSFSIEPEKLLKLGFVLHHDNANKDEMPAYQRIIKKGRLKAIQSFINNGGFFPNSVIINIVTKKQLQFDKSELQEEHSISRLGLLHLPQEYKSAYIIDGQHRLYGYSDSEWRSKNSIPVVAFVNLKLTEQIQLFMDINENQKAVPKNLRTTLEANLLWDAKDLNDQRKALSSRIAQRLGEDKNSPLYNRIVTGENSSTAYCAITLDYISKSLKATNFYNTYNKNNAVIKDGTIDKSNNDITYEYLYEFLLKMFNKLSELLEKDWEIGTNEDSCIVANAFIYGYIRIFSDIVDYIIKVKGINPKMVKADYLANECYPYLDEVAYRIEELAASDRVALRKQYGRVGDSKFWRTLQLALNERFADFNPEGLDEYWRDNSMKFNEDAFKYIRDIELYLKERIIGKLKEKYGENWFRLGCPKSVYDSAQKIASDKNYNKQDGEPDALPQDQLHLIEYREIMLHLSNWSELFEEDFADPNIKGDKKKRTEWLCKLNDIRNQNFHTYSVKEEEYLLLKNIAGWLLNKS